VTEEASRATAKRAIAIKKDPPFHVSNVAVCNFSIHRNTFANKNGLLSAYQLSL